MIPSRSVLSTSPLCHLTSPTHGAVNLGAPERERLTTLAPCATRPVEHQDIKASPRLRNCKLCKQQMVNQAKIIEHHWTSVYHDYAFCISVSCLYFFHHRLSQLTKCTIQETQEYVKHVRKESKQSQMESLIFWYGLCKMKITLLILTSSDSDPQPDYSDIVSDIPTNWKCIWHTTYSITFWHSIWHSRSF